MKFNRAHVIIVKPGQKKGCFLLPMLPFIHVFKNLAAYNLCDTQMQNRTIFSMQSNLNNLKAKKKSELPSPRKFWNTYFIKLMAGQE